MFGSLFGNNPWGQNGGHNGGSPQSAGSGSTPTSQWHDPNQQKWGGWPGHGGSGGSGGSGGGSAPNNSQWPTSWPAQSWHGGGGGSPLYKYITSYLASRYGHKPSHHSPKPGGGSSGGGGGGSTPPPTGGGGAPPPASAAVYTPGTFDRDPALGT